MMPADVGFLFLLLTAFVIGLGTVGFWWTVAILAAVLWVTHRIRMRGIKEETKRHVEFFKNTIERQRQERRDAESKGKSAK